MVIVIFRNNLAVPARCSTHMLYTYQEVSIIAVSYWAHGAGARTCDDYRRSDEATDSCGSLRIILCVCPGVVHNVLATHAPPDRSGVVCALYPIAHLQLNKQYSNLQAD